MPNSRLTRAIRTALLTAGVAGAGLHGTAAFAQQQQTQPPGSQAIDEVVVTGTRIRSPGLVSNSPISSVDQVEIDLRQPTSVEEFISQLPAAIPNLGPGTNNGAIGGSLIDLRGLGSNRNLVLVNDRRLTPFSLGGTVNTDTIPVALIERVDLITGGASAVYGADAVTGVFNFILRRDFEGVDFNVSYGVSDENDGDRFRADLTFGANTSDGRGNVVMSVGVTDTDPVLQGDRGIGEQTLNSITGAAFGSSAATPTVTTALEGTQQFNPATGAFEPGVTPYNFNPLNLYQSPLERTQFTALGRYEIAPFAEVYGELFFTDAEVETNLAPSSTFFNIFEVPIGNPLIPQPAREQLCEVNDIAIGDCVAGNPETITGQFPRRFTEFGPRLNIFENQQFQYNLGIRGDITPTWDYDVSWSYGLAKQSQTRIQWGSLSAARQALNVLPDPETGEAVCVDPSGGCVPLNLWTEDGGITQEMLNFIDLNAILNQEVQQEIGQASVSGDLGDFRSPFASGSPIGVAFGVEHRRVSAFTASDAASQIDSEVLGTGAATPDRAGSFKLNEIYAEALVPLVTDAPGVNSLTLEAGIRHTDFDSGENSDDYRSWKVGLAWEPVDDVRFRTMLQRATRAPNVNELFAPFVTGLSSLDTDPCQLDNINPADIGVAGTLTNLCVQTGAPEGRVGEIAPPAASQINNTSGGNPELGPEVGNTFTIGGVWQPRQVENLTITADYYRIRITDAVSSPSTSDILEDCFSSSRNPNREFNEACALVDRSATTGDLGAGDALGVITPQSNLGFFRTDGVDFAATYGFDFADPGLGRLNFNLNVTRVLNFEQQPTPDSTRRDCLGFYSTACSRLVTKWKGNLRTTWNVADFNLSLNWRYLDGLNAEPSDIQGAIDGGSISAPEEFFARSIGSYSYFDLTGVWNINDNVRATLTVNNLFDRDAPNIGNTISTSAVNSGNTFPQVYDAVGRFYTLGLNVSF